MTDIVQNNTIKAVSFDSGKSEVRITAGQKALLELLKKKVETGEPLYADDIVKIYSDHVDWWLKDKSRTSFPIRYQILNHTYKIWEWTQKEVSREEYIKQRSDYLRRISKIWLKNNLGACILKGKLLAIPIIETE